MNWQEFEEHMKAGIPSHESEVNTEQLWNAIQEKKRRRRPLWWWFAGAGLLLAVLCWWNPFTHSLQQPNADQYPTKNIPETAGSVASTSALNQAATANATAAQPHLLPGAATPSAASNLPQNQTLTSDNHADHNSTTAQLLPSHATQHRLQSQQFTTKNTPIPATTQEAAILSPAQNPAENPLVNKTSDNAPTTILPGYPVLAPALPVPLVPVSIMPIGQRPPLPVFSRFSTPPPPVVAPKSIMMGVEAASGGWNIRQRGDTALLRHLGETRLEFVDIGVHFRLPVHPRWTLTTGLGYARYNSVFRWTKQWSVNSILAPATYVNGTRDSVPVFSRINYERKVKHYNRISALRIPVEAHYTLAWKNYTIAPFVGVNIDLLQHASGKMEDFNGEPTNNLKEEYTRQAVIGTRMGITGSIPIQDGWQCTISPFFATDFSPRSTNGQERFSQWGIGVGVWKNLR